MSQSIDISDVVAASGLPASTLHVWERNGLVTPIGRNGIRRTYDIDVLDRIASIVVLQRAGFTLAEIKELLAPDAFVDGKGALEAKLQQLQEQRRALDRAITGLEHAMACTAPSPLECDGYRRHIEGVLPVQAPDRAQRRRSTTE